MHYSFEQICVALYSKSKIKGQLDYAFSFEELKNVIEEVTEYKYESSALYKTTKRLISLCVFVVDEKNPAKFVFNKERLTAMFPNLKKELQEKNPKPKEGG